MVAMMPKTSSREQPPAKTRTLSSIYDTEVSQSIGLYVFLVADTQLYERHCPSVRRSVGHGDRVGKCENAHPSATGIGRVSGLVIILLE